MKTILIAATTTLILTFSTAAFASGDEHACKNISGERMTKDAIKTKFTGLGYEVKRIKDEDGCYEVYAITKEGSRVELYVNPVTGDVVKTERD